MSTAAGSAAAAEVAVPLPRPAMADVLFVCVHNAGRSQMAKALFNQLAKKRSLALRAESAGTEPAARIHANVARAMHELGVDLSGERPKPLTNAMVEQAARVITMGCAVDSARCPAVLVKRGVEDWGLPDPKGKGVTEVRTIRDTIRQKVNGLIDSLDYRQA